MQSWMKAYAPILMLCLGMILGGLLIWRLDQGGDPYDLRHISTGQIAAVRIFPPYAAKREATLNDEEIQRLVAYLNRVNLLGKGDQDFRNVDGLCADTKFRITRVDGTEFTFDAGTPFYILDSEFGYNTFGSEVGYTAEDVDLCEEIHEFSLELNEKYFGRAW